MKSTQIIGLGATLAGLAVILGAFGAHALESTLEANGRLDTYETASQYLMYHSLALIGLGILRHQFPQKKLAIIPWLWLGGILFFCGSLFVLAITGVTLLGAVAPIGGMGFILGWLGLAIRYFKD
ncbi:MAG TPA: DUF423 domain-containing protein [Cytophagales bacterium]|nr:DUF423 domain-containing protein [Cytophagales bacterium]HAA24035.1 DUF423 domain-containing protein [Cytophagales bacterium]HAP64679.1 DUF423 domain-containing protein [Cytophagales bacterium]